MLERPDWMRASVIIGHDGVIYRPILLATDGSMFAVLKGEYGEELRTVKLDDKGRLSAFIIDSVDAWGRMLSIGNAELAARLGSVVLYEKRGQVFLADSFEHGLAVWKTDKPETLSLISVSPASAFSAGYSIKMTSAAAGDHFLSLYWVSGLCPTTTVGAEVTFAPATEFVDISIRLNYFSGTHLYQAWLQYDHANNDLEIVKQNLGYQWIADKKAIISAGKGFNRMKIVADLATERYVRCFFNDTEHNLLAYDMRVIEDPLAPQVQLYIWLTGRAGNADIVYIDSVIFTTAEPT